MTSLSSSLSSVDFLLLKSSAGRPPNGVSHLYDDPALFLRRTGGSSPTTMCGGRRNDTTSEFVRRGSMLTLGARPPGPIPTVSRSSRRMSAMLKSPAVRKYFAESLGLDPNSANVDDHIRMRLGGRHRSEAIHTSAGNSKQESVAEMPTAKTCEDMATGSRWAESDVNRKRYRSTNDVTECDLVQDDDDVISRLPNGNQQPDDQLQRLLTVGESESSRDQKNDVTRLSNDVTRGFKMPTFDEFVRARRTSKSQPSRDTTAAGDDVITNRRPSATGNGLTAGRCLMTSFGGSCDELNRADADIRSTKFMSRSRDVSMQRNDSRRDDVIDRMADRKQKTKTTDCDGLTTYVFTRSGSLRRRPRDRPRLPVNNTVTSHPFGDDDLSSQCSNTSGDDSSAPLNDDVIINTVSSAVNKDGGTSQVTSGQSCQHKPPAHPHTHCHHRPPTVAHQSPRVAVTEHSQDSSASLRHSNRRPDRHRQKHQHADKHSTSGQLMTSSVSETTADYDPAIWDFLSDDVCTSAPCEVNQPLAETCGSTVDNDVIIHRPRDSGRNVEQAEAVREIIDTEISYGNDLAIMRNEFYLPLKNNGLLIGSQLDGVFLNLAQLMTNNEFFLKRLQVNETADSESPNSHSIKNVLHQANSRQNCSSSCIGRAFLESRHMLIAFETYCINQSAAVYLVDQLTQERELLRVFLEQLPKERPTLRKMDLKSFLMIPVQRVMKYPLLLDRLYKATPDEHPDKNDIHLARKYIEHTLSSINAKAIGSLKMKRRSSAGLQLLLKRVSTIDNIELTQFVFELLKWSRNETRLLLVARLMCSSVASHRSVNKFQRVHCVLATLGLPPNYYSTMDIGIEPGCSELVFPPTCADEQTTLRQAVVVLVKEKAGKFTALQPEPMMLDKCILSSASMPHSLELHEMNKATYQLKSDDVNETQLWYKQLRHLTMVLGHWRRRRNALPNIMTHRHDDFT